MLRIKQPFLVKVSHYSVDGGVYRSSVAWVDLLERDRMILKHDGEDAVEYRRGKPLLSIDSIVGIERRWLLVSSQVALWQSKTDHLDVVSIEWRA